MFPLSLRPRNPIAVGVRPKPRPALRGVHSRTSGRAEPKFGRSTPVASPKRHSSRSRAGGPLVYQEGKPSPASEATRSARRPGSRAMWTKVAPFQGRRDPACRHPCTGRRSALARRSHALTTSSREDGCRLPNFTRKEGKRKETPALQPARRRTRGGQVPMEQSLGARQTPERRALLRARAARGPGFEEPPRFYL